MTILLQSIDVGLKYYALAQFQEEGLTYAALIPFVEPVLFAGVGMSPHGSRLVIECATVRARDGATKQKEVDALNRAAGRLGALHPNPEFLLPERWKGQTPKKIDQERTLRALTERERLCLPKKKSELLHVLDAIGIGLHALGRR